MKLNTVKRQSYSINLKNTSVSSFFSSLPFDLTNAQKRVVKEIFTDIEKDKAMTRIVQGDVGSGKTAVAASAIYICAKNGYQAAMMAPTEVLASQHFKSLTKMFDGFGIKTELLTGSMTVKSKKDIYTRLLNGEIDVLIGTHAIFQSSVEYKNLALVVTDEQHRFGVMQRAALSDKGQNALQPHTLVMSATPIPRTLSLVIYGDLDISILDEYPVGRQKIDTFFVDESYRQRIISFLKKELSAGHQAFIICPLIEESETNDYDDKKSVVEYIKKIEPLFAPYSIGMVHGKQKPAEKNEAMRKFHDNESQILVSTTVVEVGVDVPNATVMLIENAECFGLSQLHQLRGRVGRGTAKSYCVLMSDIKNEKSRERLDVMVSTNDGFEIAEADLATRGPGDFFGSRQSGAFVFKSASIADFELIELTKKLVEKLSNDTEYYNKYPALTHAVNSFLEHMKTDNTFN